MLSLPFVAFRKKKSNVALDLFAKEKQFQFIPHENSMLTEVLLKANKMGKEMLDNCTFRTRSHMQICSTNAAKLFELKKVNSQAAHGVNVPLLIYRR